MPHRTTMDEKKRKKIDKTPKWNSTSAQPNLYTERALCCDRKISNVAQVACMRNALKF